MNRHLLSSLLVLALAAPAVRAQYTPPGANLAGDTRTMKGFLARAVDEARWRLGRVAVDPWIGIRDVSYIDTTRNQGVGIQTPADTSVSAGAGLRAYLPVGEETTWVAYLLPEYQWWNRLTERNRLNGRYGLGWFGSVGRTQVQALVSRIEDARVFSRELEQKVNSKSEIAALGLDLPLAGGLELFGAGSVKDLGYNRDSADQPRIDRVNREERVWRAGLRYRVEGVGTIGLGYQDADIQFDEPGSLRSNTDQALVIAASWNRPRFALALDLAKHDLVSDLGPASLDYDEWGGELATTFRVAGPLELIFGGERRLVYSFQNTWAWFEDESLEAGVRIAFNANVNLRLAVDDGRNRYFPFDVEDPLGLRTDDFTQLSAVMTFKLLNRFTLVLGYSETEYDSNLPQGDRSVTNLRTSLQLGAGGASPWG